MSLQAAVGTWVNKGRCSPCSGVYALVKSHPGRSQHEITLGGVVRNGGISDKTQTIATEGN